MWSCSFWPKRAYCRSLTDGSRFFPAKGRRSSRTSRGGFRPERTAGSLILAHRSVAAAQSAECQYQLADIDMATAKCGCILREIIFPHPAEPLAITDGQAGPAGGRVPRRKRRQGETPRFSGLTADQRLWSKVSDRASTSSVLSVFRDFRTIDACSTKVSAPALGAPNNKFQAINLSNDPWWGCHQSSAIRS